MRRLAASLVLLAVIVNAQSAMADDGVCRKVFDSTHARVMAVLQDSKDSTEQRRAMLIKLFDDTVDTGWVAQAVAGPYWDKASDSDRKNYVNVYRDFISGYYLGSVDGEDFATTKDIKLIEFTESSPNNFDMQIEIEQTDDAPAEVYLHLVSGGGTCRVHDFKVEGVSLLVSQKDEIQALGAAGGLPFITQQLAAHIAKKKN